MKRKGLGEIIDGGGFSKFFRELEELGEPYTLTRQGKAVALIMPATEESASLVSQSINLAQALERFESNGDFQNMELFLLGQFLSGIASRSVLGQVFSNNGLRLLEDNLVTAVRESIKRQLQEEVGSAGEQPIAPAIGNEQKGRSVKKAVRPTAQRNRSRKREKLS